jgi:hypothetical protein
MAAGLITSAESAQPLRRADVFAILFCGAASSLLHDRVGTGCCDVCDGFLQQKVLRYKAPQQWKVKRL